MSNKKDLSSALSQRKSVPPLQRGKGIQLSSDEAVSQNGKNIDLQKSETEVKQQSDKAPSQFRNDVDCDVSQFRDNAGLAKNGQAVSQTSEIVEQQKDERAMTQNSISAITEKSAEVISQESEISEEQVRYLAKMLQKFTAKEQGQEKAKKQKEDPALLLIQALADLQFPIPELEQFRNIAQTQKRKVNQGVTIPEALFTIYKSSAMALTLKGNKVTMGDLMAKALIKYLVEEIVPELGSQR